MNRIFILFFSLTSFIVFSQNTIIKGTVTDSNSEPLFSSNVVVDITKSYATQTDFDGNYSISITEGNYSISASFIGKETKKRTFSILKGETKVINIVLNDDNTEVGFVTVTSGKYEKKFGEEVVSIEVLPSNIIENNSAQADEALTKVPGYTKIGKNASLRGGSGFAGGASSRVMVLVDGVPSLSPESGTINFANLPIENLKQVEVIKGASSAMYGSSALNGIINFRTSWAKKEVFTRFSLSGGYFGNYSSKLTNNIDDWRKTENHKPVFGNFTFEHRKRFKKIDLVFGANYRNNQGFRKNNELQRVRVNGKIRHISKKIEGLTFGLAWNATWEGGATFFMWSGLDSLTSIPSASIVRFNSDGSPNTSNTLPVKDQRTTYINRIVELNPFITFYDKKENKHSLRFRFYNNFFTNFGYESSLTNHIYGDYTFYKKIKQFGIDLTAGLSGFYTTTNGKTFNNKSHKAYNSGAFFQIDKKFIKKITVSAGIRLSYNKIDTVAPLSSIPIISLFKKNKTLVRPLLRLGINYEIQKGTYLRASYGEGFRVPTISELYVYTVRGTIIKPNPTLLTEEGWSTEIGIKQVLKKGNWLGYFDFASFVTGYKNYIEFLPSFDNEGNIYFSAKNSEKARISGFEFSALGKGKILGFNTTFIGGYTFTSPINLGANKALPYKKRILNYRSQHSAKADIEFSIKKISIGFSTLYNSNMVNIPNIQTNIPGIKEYRKLDKNGYIIFDSRIRYEFNKKLKLSFITKNLLNETYSTRPGMLETPRSYTLLYQHQF